MRAITAALAAIVTVTISALSTGAGGKRGTITTKLTVNDGNHHPSSTHLPQQDRRSIFASTLLVSAGLLAPKATNAAVDVSSLAPALSDRSIFLGTYTDPVNHPGGTREISFSGTGFAGYDLAVVKGGGGQGEPEYYELPAMVFKCPGNAQQNAGKWCITIDFSPKGGPKYFQGYYDDEKKGIRFVLDNNFWPQQ